MLAEKQLRRVLLELEADLAGGEEQIEREALETLKQLNCAELCQTIKEGPYAGQSRWWRLAKIAANGAPVAFFELISQFEKELSLSDFMQQPETGTDQGKSVFWFLIFLTKSHEIDIARQAQNWVEKLLATKSGYLHVESNGPLCLSIEELLKNNEDDWSRKIQTLIVTRNEFFKMVEVPQQVNNQAVHLFELAMLALQASEAGYPDAIEIFNSCSEAHQSSNANHKELIAYESEEDLEDENSPNIFALSSNGPQHRHSVENLAKEWENAIFYFNYYPSEIKLKKGDGRLHSFIKAHNGLIFRAANRHIPGEGILGEGGIATVKIATGINGDVYTMKVEGGTLQEQNPDELAIEDLRGSLKGIAERPLGFTKTVKGREVQSKVYKFLNYVPGQSLNNMDVKSWPLTRQLVLALEIALKLTAIHKLDFVHSDIKEENIIVKESDKPHLLFVELIDFNISHYLPAKPSVMARYAGTPGYMAPEVHLGQATGVSEFSKASDVYALGKLFQKIFGWNENGLYSLIQMMINDSPHSRPSLEKILTTIAAVLTKQHKDAELTELLGRVKNALLIGNPPVLNMQPRTVRAEAVHGLSPYVNYRNILWRKITSNINFVHQPERYWIYLGSDPNREKLLFDMGSRKINYLQLQALTQTIGLPVPEILKKVNGLVNSVANSSPEGEPIDEVELDKRLETYLANCPKEEESIFLSMDELIEKKLLVCRHRALLATCLLTFLVKHGILPKGYVRCYRSDLGGAMVTGAHGWATYRNINTGQLWICDPRWNKVIEVTDPNSKEQFKMEYGFYTFQDMILRLNYIELLVPWVGRFNQLKGQTPCIRQIAICNNTASTAGMHIRIDLYPLGSANEKSALKYAFNQMGIRFTEYIHVQSHVYTIEVAYNLTLAAFEFAAFFQNYHKALEVLNLPISNPEPVIPQFSQRRAEMICRLTVSDADLRAYHKAAKENNLEEIKRIEEKSNVNKRTKGVALKEAIQNGSIEVILYLASETHCTFEALQGAFSELQQYKHKCSGVEEHFNQLLFQRQSTLLGASHLR